MFGGGGAFVALEIKILLEQNAGVRKALGRTTLVKIEHGERGAEVLLEDGVAEPGPNTRKALDIRHRIKKAGSFVSVCA